MNIPLPIDIPVRFGDIELDPALFPPTFKSFAVIRVYSLVLKVKILCLEKYFEVGVVFPNLKILPARVWPGLVDGTQQSVVNGTNVRDSDVVIDVADLDVAPLYEKYQSSSATDTPPAYSNTKAS